MYGACIVRSSYATLRLITFNIFITVSTAEAQGSHNRVIVWTTDGLEKNDHLPQSSDEKYETWNEQGSRYVGFKQKALVRFALSYINSQTIFWILVLRIKCVPSVKQNKYKIYW